MLAAGLGRRRLSRPRLLGPLAVAAAPTLATWCAEFVVGLPVSSMARALAAAPLGAVTTFAIIGLVRPSKRIG
jgi:hypothetical protein